MGQSLVTPSPALAWMGAGEMLGFSSWWEQGLLQGGTHRQWCLFVVVGTACPAEQPLLSTPVIYNGCPKAFEAGIWWPQTKFGQPAAVPCPKGSVGESPGPVASTGRELRHASLWESRSRCGDSRNVSC